MSGFSRRISAFLAPLRKCAPLPDFLTRPFGPCDDLGAQGSEPFSRFARQRLN